ncbi:MAG TPA: TfoX/Sxy family protein [Geminicoccaceae bacterium]
MARDAALATLVAELLTPLGGVTIRRMFGGHGIFKSGLMFGLIADGLLYLRTDDLNRRSFEDAGLEQFVHTIRGRAVAMPYYRAPDAGLDDPDLLCAWAREAHAAALRQKRAGRRGRR